MHNTVLCFPLDFSKQGKRFIGVGQGEGVMFAVLKLRLHSELINIIYT